MKRELEKSLKRYLKRKVRITLGFVTAFAIIGNIGMAMEVEENLEAQEKFKEKLTTIKEVAEKFEGVGTFSLETLSKNVGEQDSIQIIVEKDGDINKISIGENTIEIDKNYLTEDIKNSIDEVLKNANIIKTSKVKGMDIEQNEIVSVTSGNGQETTTEKTEIINNGIILNTAASNGKGQFAKDAKAVNNGIILSTTYGQQGKELYNDGLINSTFGQVIEEKGINNGIIIANNNGDGQFSSVIERGEIINNGIIKVNGGGSGQDLATGSKNMEVINYGLISSGGNGQLVKAQQTENNKIENYGIIISNGVGQNISGGIGNTSYNYGLIKSNGTGINIATGGNGYNYGVVVTNGALFSNNVINKGIGITDNNIDFSKSTWAQTGVIVDSLYNLRNIDYVHEFNNEAVIDDNAFIESGKNIGYIKDKSIQIDNLTGKTIGAVVTKDSSIETPIFTYTGVSKDGLFLNDTTLTGYFEKEGTLLDVGKNKLILGGETKITAVKSDLDLNVVAIKVGEGGSLTLSGNADVNGVIEGLEDSDIDFVNYKKQFALNNSGLTEVKNLEEDIAYVNYTNTTFASGTTKGLQTDFTHTSEGLINRIVIKNDVVLEKVDGESWAFKDVTQDREGFEKVKTEVIFENLSKSLEGDIIFGEGENTLIVNNSLRTQTEESFGDVPESFDYEIDLGVGNDDKFIVNYNSSFGESYNTFNYNVTNAETVELSGGIWKVGEGGIKFTGNTKADEIHNATLKITNGAIFDITLSGVSGGSDLANAIEEGFIDKNNTDLVLSTDETSKIRYKISENGLDFNQLSTDNYSISTDANVVAPIFNVSSDGKNGVNISVKTAQEAGVASYKPIYDAIIKELSSDIKNKDVIDKINNMDSKNDIVDFISNTDIAAQAYYTAGTIVTKNITDSYVSAVEDFGKKANKGEWITTAKYINSNTEFDGGNKVKGYDGDINSAVGIIEYGITDNTSYGTVFGGGKTNIDINGGGSLEGDNFYLGAYVKHKTENNIDIVGNIGIIKSDLDSKLTQEFKFTSGNINLNGKSNVDGTADSSAITASVMAKKNYYVTDTVRLEPLTSLRYTLIKQDTAENKDMGFSIQKQDASVFEATVGLNTVKELRLEKGLLELNAGVKYTFAGTSEDEDVRYNLYSSQDLSLTLEGAELGDNKGTAFIGIGYEHENGIGFNGKYEMIWSDSGDDSRFTAGLSYRF